MATSYVTRNGRTAKQGLFVDGVWKCDCDPRLPADKFQVKNGGKNHGRWFYTCQKSNRSNKGKKGCQFWLWADDAKVREESAVLSNSRSEPNPPAPPRTPKKQTRLAVPPTPQTSTTKAKTEVPPTPGQRQIFEDVRHDDSFGWSSSDDEELLKAEQEVLQRTPSEPRNKTPRTEAVTSPGKRTFGQMAAPASKDNDTWPLSDDVFTTPSTSHKSNGTGLPSPFRTPANRLDQATAGAAEPSSLASEVLEILKRSNQHLTAAVENELVDLLNKHDLRTQGIIRGRDITRLAVQAKDQKITELQGRISTLEAEKETNRRVISHLKLDVAASSKKTRGRNVPAASRSEV